MQKLVLLLDGPIGVGKTSLGRFAADKLGFDFVDRDDLSGSGPWLRSVLKTSRKIVEACEMSLQNYEGVIVAVPTRFIEWHFFSINFQRMGFTCHSIGLLANSDAIEARERELSAGERARSREMIDQGYGQRAFSALTIRTDETDFNTTGQRLVDNICKLAGVK